MCPLMRLQNMTTGKNRNDNGNIIVKMGVSGPLSKMEEEGISYEILEELVPTYESSTAKMIFNWGY